jgi:hypothetical protein
MWTVKRIGMFAAACGVALTLAAPSLAAGVKEPEEVKSGLAVMSQSVSDTGKLAAEKGFDKIPAEVDEFGQAVSALRKAIADDKASFRSTVNPIIIKAVNSSERLASASKGGDADKVSAAQASFAKAVKALIDEFPEDVRPAA